MPAYYRRNAVLQYTQDNHVKSTECFRPSYLRRPLFKFSYKMCLYFNNMEMKLRFVSLGNEYGICRVFKNI